MALTRDQKQKIVQDICEKIEKQKAMLFVGFKGLKAQDVLALKKKLRAANGVLKVCKKTLLGLAMSRKKLEVDAKALQEQVAVVFGFGDASLVVKTVCDFSKAQENLTVLGGLLENKFQDKDYLVAISKLPSKEELLARFVGALTAPLNNLVYVLQGNIKGLVVALSAIIKEKK